MTAHSPGPWRWSDNTPIVGRGNLLAAEGNRRKVLTPLGPAQVLVSDADARLIAAAPALLSLLKDLVAGVETDNLPGHLIMTARTLIERVEGGRG